MRAACPTISLECAEDRLAKAEAKARGTTNEGKNRDLPADLKMDVVASVSHRDATRSRVFADYTFLVTSQTRLLEHTSSDQPQSQDHRSASSRFAPHSCGATVRLVGSRLHGHFSDTLCGFTDKRHCSVSGASMVSRARATEKCIAYRVCAAIRGVLPGSSHLAGGAGPVAAFLPSKLARLHVLECRFRGPRVARGARIALG